MRWTEIEQSDRWKTLTADQRRAARERYFDEFVAPEAPKHFDPEELRTKWMSPYAAPVEPEEAAEPEGRSVGGYAQDRLLGIGKTGLGMIGTVTDAANRDFGAGFLNPVVGAARDAYALAGKWSPRAKALSDAITAREKPASEFAASFADKAQEYAAEAGYAQSDEEKRNQAETSAAMQEGPLVAAGYLFANPMRAADTLVDSAPYMAAGGAVGGAVARVGGTANAILGANLGTSGALMAEGSGADARQAVAERLAATPEDKIVEQFPDYPVLAAQYGPDEAKRILAERAAGAARAAGTAINTVTLGLGSKLAVGERLLSGTLRPGASASRMSNAGRGLVSEAVQEGTEEVGEGAATLLGESSARPSTDLTEGLASRGVMGAFSGAPGGAAGGFMQTPAEKGAADATKAVADANLGLVVNPVDGYTDEDAKLDALLAGREAESAVAIPGGSEVVAADAQPPLAADPNIGSFEPDLTAEAYDRARRDIRRSETMQRAESGVPVEQLVPQAPQVTVVEPQDSLRSRRDAARARNDFSAYLDEHGVDMAESDRLSNFEGDRIPQPSGEPVTVGESRISGKGIIATAPIVKPITLFDTTMAGTGRTDAGRFVNHSPQPNADVKLVQGRIIAIPNRPIETGQEVTINYREIDPIREQFAKSQYVPEPTPVNPTDYRSTAQADPEKNPEAFGLPKPLKPRRLKRTPADFDENYDDAMDFLALNGGLNRKAWASEGVDPDMLTRKKGNDHQRRFGLGPTLFPASGGMTPSEAREKLQGMGFLAADPDNATATIEDDDAVQMVMESINQGRKFLLPAGAEVEQRAADITRMADSASRDVKVMDELGLKDRDIDEANEFDNRERIQFSQPEDRARQIGTRIALDALKEFRAGDIDASALSDLLDSEELAVARRSGQGEPKATGNVTQDVRAKWDDRSRRFGLSNTLQRATEDVAGAFLGREFGESSDSFYGRDESARALRDWLNEKRGVEFSQPSSADTSNPRGEGVGFAHGQEALASRLVQWSSALRLGRAGPRPMEQRPESIGAVNRNAAGAAEQGDATREAIREQSARLIEQAKAGGYYWPNGSQILAEIGKLQTLGGAEHQVFLAGDVDSGNGFVIRATDNGFFGPRSDISPAQYLARLDDYSATFPDLQTRLIGISESPDIPGHAVIWSAQPFVRGKKFRNQRELAEAMAAHGWDVDGNEGDPRFIHRENGAIIEDAHTDNVFHDGNGNLYPFDVVVEAMPRYASGNKVYPRSQNATGPSDDFQYSQPVGRKVAPAAKRAASRTAERKAPTDSGVPKDAPSKRSLVTDRLPEKLGSIGKGLKFERVVLPDALSGALDALGRITGRNVVVFRVTEGSLSANGFVIPGDPNIYVNADAASPVLTIASHEFLHKLRSDNPKLYDFVRSEVEKRADMAKWRAEIDSRKLTSGKNKLSDALVIEELAADALGDAMTDPQFLAGLAKRNPSKFRAFVMAALEFFGDIARKMGKVQDLGSSQYLSDIAGLREAYAQMLSDYDAGVMPDESEGIVKFSIPPDVARSIVMQTELPADAIFREAVANTKGAEIEADGLLIDLVRYQKPEQSGDTSVRTGVFYLPTGSAQEKHYRGGKSGYGGMERVQGKTMLRRPLFAKGGTGGKAPEAAYNALKGKGAYEAMRSDVLSAMGYGLTLSQKADRAAAVLEKYGADPGVAYELVRNSQQGNTFAYAMQENIVAHAVRDAGYDSVVGYSKGKSGPFISEVFDVREDSYPTSDGEYSIHPKFAIGEPQAQFSQAQAVKPAFYSALAAAIQSAQGAPKRADATAWKQWLDGAQRRGEFKQSERDWLGVDAWLDGRETTTRDEIAEFVRANQVEVQETVLADDAKNTGEEARRQELQRMSLADLHDEASEYGIDPDSGNRAHIVDAIVREERGNDDDTAGSNGRTKFASYQTPGGSNYRELLLTLPDAATEADSEGRYRVEFFDETGRGRVEYATMPQVEAFRRRGNRADVLGPVVRRDDSKNFKSSHFDQPNILAHVRFNERTDADGKRVLFVEEVQSDWHQAGRKNGYAGAAPPAGEVYEDDGRWRLRSISDKTVWFDSEKEAADFYGSKGVPDAPLKKEWPLTAMKRMIRYASENGFDRIAWTTGDQQAERYDLSKHIDMIEYRAYGDGTYQMSAMRRGSEVLDERNVTIERIAEVVGKEIAEKIERGEGARGVDGAGRKIGQLSGLQLKVGGEGMRAFYDKMLPNELGKYVKKWGGKVGSTKIAETGGAIVVHNVPVHSLDITPSMRESAMQGQPLFSQPKAPAQAAAENAQKRATVGAATGAQQPITFTYGDRFGSDIKGRLNAARVVMQDKMLSALFVQNDIEAARGPIEDAVNVYRRENLMHGRSGDQLEQLKRRQVDPLMKAIKAEGLDDSVVEDYLEAKFAPERNKIIAAKNPNMPDGGSGMTDAEAADFLAGRTDGLRSGRKIDKAGLAKLAKIGNLIQSLRNETLDRLESSGQIDAAAKAAMIAQAPNYVPLRGKDGAEITGGRGSGKGIDVRGRPIKEAMGRGAGNRAINILAEVVVDAERSIIEAEKLRVGKTLARLVLENPNPDLWDVEPVRTEQKVDSVGQVYQAVMPNAQDQDAIRIMHNGKPYFVRLADPKLRDAMKNLGADNSGAIIRFMGGINRYFSAILTRYNPSFISVNALRDLGFGMTSIASEHGTKIAANAAAKYPEAMRAMWRDNRNTLGNSTMDRYAREFSEAGARTFFAKRDSVEEMSGKIAAEFKSYGNLLRGGNIGLAVNKAVNNSSLLKVVNDANDAVENAMRLSAYAALRESGKSVEQAAEYAKNITVNFNRKGQAASGINAVILFYNAATQGAHRSILLLKNPKVMAAVGGMAGLQALLAAYAMGADDEDEDGLTAWEKIPDYEKERNLIIPIVGHDANGKRRIRMVKWPMPYGFNVFTYAGGKMAELGMSKEPKPAKFANDMGGAVVNAFSPIKFIDGMDGIKPHFVKIFDALGANKDDLGFPIRDENQFAPFEEPRASMGKADTPEAYKAAAKALNRMGGGDEVTPPKIMRGLLDWAPEDLEYLTEQLTGGIGRFASDSYGVGEKLFAGIDTNPKDYPILRSLVSEVDTNRATAGIYYDRKETIEREKARLKLKFKEDGLAAARTIVSETPALQGFRLKRFKSTGKYTDKAGNVELEAAAGSLANAYKAAEKRVKDLNAQIREAQAASYPSLKAKVEKIRGLQAEREKAQSEFNAVYAKRRQ